MTQRDEGIWGGPVEKPADVVDIKAAPPALPPTPPRTGAEWGLASLLVGCTLLLLAPLDLLVWSSIVSVTAVRWDRASLVGSCLALIGAQFGLGLLLLACVGFALYALRAARTERAPVGLPLAALLVGIMDILFWLMIMVTSFTTTGGLLR